MINTRDPNKHIIPFTNVHDLLNSDLLINEKYLPKFIVPIDLLSMTQYQVRRASSSLISSPVAIITCGCIVELCWHLFTVVLYLIQTEMKMKVDNSQTDNFTGTFQNYQGEVIDISK